jgi:nicotinate-nucleotide--dimethylbenzimidazole phosphoribosyltransferase
METLSELSLEQRLRHRIDNKTKPLGALGHLENLAFQVGAIQNTVRPQIHQPHIVVFAGDHGIAAKGLVNPYPQAVTAQMVLNFLAGGAAINVFCRQHDIGLTVVDAGVNFDFSSHSRATSRASGYPDFPGSDDSAHFDGFMHKSAPVRFLSHKIGYGTRNYLEGTAMSHAGAMQAIDTGKKIVDDLQAEGCNCIGLGEMGIGNTSSASLIMSIITGIPIENCTGRGTGVNDEQLQKKKETLRAVFDLHAGGCFTTAIPSVKTSGLDPLEILQRVGGFEIAMMAGAYLRAAEHRMIILVDGFITTAALLVALLFDSSVRDYCIFSHTSGEQGHEKMLQWLDAHPILNLGMRLGEGTGAALALPIVRSAVRFLNEMASFESAGVDKA